METPVALFVFNRPELTRRVLTSIRAARPRNLLVVADGARPEKAGEADRVAEVRRVIDEGITWPCNCERIYANSNLGCGRRLATGLDAVFSQVERAIVLEDDCLPDASFFPYCEELLERFSQEPRIGVVSGDNFQHRRAITSHSYYFSRYPHCWGWATWRRAWQKHDSAMAAWPARRRDSWLATILDSPAEQAYWRDIFDQTHGGRIDTWDYQWTFTCWNNDWLTALPATNLVSNIGFGAAGTHTEHPHPAANLPTVSLQFPLKHPSSIVRDHAADNFTFRHHFARPPWWRRVWRRLKGR